MTVAAEEADCVRVRVLEKYHPQIISVRVDGDVDELVLVNRESALPIEFRSAQEYTIEIPGQVERNYTGRLVIDWEEDELVVVNVLPLEDYVASVVLSELGWADIEAMRAQAVLARTWAITHRRSDRPYDFDDLTNSQVYKGLFPHSRATHDRLVETLGQILVYRRKPIDAIYHAACTDHVYSAYEVWGVEHVPYLGRVELPSILAPTRDNNAWNRAIPKTDVDALFQADVMATKTLRYRKTHRRGQLGVYVNERWFGIDEFRLRINRALGWNQIRSNDFTLQARGNILYFRGKGFGHLVGLCQQDAVILAEHGLNYEQILNLFYPGTEIATYDPSTTSP